MWQIIVFLLTLLFTSVEAVIHTYVTAFRNDLTVVLLVGVANLAAVRLLTLTSNEGERTFSLVILLMVTSLCIALTYNYYIALVIFILEIGMITTLVILQQAYYSSKITNFAPILILMAYPVTSRANSYFQIDIHNHYTYSDDQEPARAIQRAVLLPEENFALLLLLALTLASIFLAAFIFGATDRLKLQNSKKVIEGVRTDRIIIYKKYTNESRVKLLSPGVIIS